MGGTVSDPEQDKIWTCTGQRYRSTKGYRTTWPPVGLVSFPGLCGKGSKITSLGLDSPMGVDRLGVRILAPNEALNPYAQYNSLTLPLANP